MKNRGIVAWVADSTEAVTALSFYLYFGFCAVVGVFAAVDQKWDVAAIALGAAFAGIIIFGAFAVFLQLRSDVKRIADMLESREEKPATNNPPAEYGIAERAEKKS